MSVKKIESPKVTIAIPVYNGELFIEQAIESVLNQSFDDWELIICDNASTDSTTSICEGFVKSESRIRYFRNDKNIGAAMNFNRTVELARGSYFRWLASDSSLDSKFIEECVSILDNDSSIASVSTGFASILSHDGSKLEEIYTNFNFNIESTHVRIKSIIDRVIRIRGPLLVWAMMRTKLLSQTGLIRPFIGSDSVFILEYGLKGKIAFIDKPLSKIRRHQDSYSNIKDSNDGVEGVREARWFDPNSTGKTYFPHWRRLGEFFKVIVKSENSFTCKFRMVNYLIYPLGISWSNRLVKEIFFAFGLGFLYKKLKKLIKT